MSRLIQRTVVLAKLETTYGTDAVPTPGSNALLVSNASFEIMAQNIDRPLLRGYIGANSQLVGSRFVKVTFEVEVSGSGTAGTAPAWGPLLRACAMAEVVTAAQMVEYTPVSSALESLTIYYYDDGVLKKALGAEGTFELDLSQSTRPVFKFTFTGLDGGLVAQTNPAQTLTAWKPPLAITNPNTAAINLGCTYAAGALTGGTPYPGRGLTLNVANDVQQNDLLGGQSVEITNRNASGSMELDLTAAQEVAFMADVYTNTLITLGLVHGTSAGAKVLIFAPAVQRTDPKQADYNGHRHITMTLRLTPLSGNDELRIVAL